MYHTTRENRRRTRTKEKRTFTNTYIERETIRNEGLAVIVARWHCI